MEDVFQEFAYKTDQRTYPLHTHLGYQIIYLKAGTLSLRIADDEYNAAAPCFIFFNNMEPHSISATGAENCRYLINISSKSARLIVKDKTYLSVFSAAKDSLKAISVTDYAPKFDTLFEIMSEAHRNKTIGCTEIITYSFNLILALLNRICPRAFEPTTPGIRLAVSRICDLIEADPGSEVRLSGLSDEFHFSESYLLHSFKKYSGYGIKQYRMSCRVAFACELLTATDKSITDICFESGFTDISNFTRYFKAKTGLTPTNYRKAFSGENTEDNI